MDDRLQRVIYSMEFLSLVDIDTVQDYLCREWVDEVFVKVTDTQPYPRKLIDEIVTMGLTVHLSLGSVEQSLSGKKFVEKIGDYTVVTSSINTISPKADAL